MAKLNVEEKFEEEKEDDVEEILEEIEDIDKFKK